MIDPFAPLNGAVPAAAPDVPAWHPIMPAPLPMPSVLRHTRHGVASMVWRYVGESGALLFAVARFDGADGTKQILPYSCDARGWRWAGLGDDRPLYRLDDLAARPDDPVLVVEGEKTADAAAALFPEWVVTTWPGGSNAVHKADWSILEDRRVVIWPDADRPGRRAADAIRAILPTAQIVTIPDDWPDGWDLADPSPDGADLLVMLSGTGSALDEPPPPADEHDYGTINKKTNGKPVVEVLPPEFADDALALAFSSSYGDVARYVAMWGRWYLWDGTVWRHDDTLRIRNMARLLARSYAVNAPTATQKAVTGRKTIDAITHLAQSDRRHAATVDQWDADPWLLNTPAGIVDLQTGEVAPHDPALHMTKITSVAPAEAADCPLWMNFLNRTFAGDQSMIGYVQRMLGYCLTGITREHAMFFCYGTGRNGKGVLLNTVSAIMGDYALAADPTTFTAGGQGKHLTTLARLQGARLVTAQETEEGEPWAEARIKSITGGDPITANFMRQDHFTFLPNFKLVMAGNHKPALRNVDEAIRARFNLIPFTTTIPAAERDPELPAKLLEEAPSILRWIIEGCHDWRHVSLKPPQVVKDATLSYFQDEDIFSQFIESRCKTGNEFHRSGSTALYKEWSAWAKASGEPAMSQKRFSQTIEARGFSRVRTATGYDFVGISIAVPGAVTDPENDTKW
jgi:putative DNA primase/helicase